MTTASVGCRRPRPADLEIHQIKYPTEGAERDLNVIFPIERLQELALEASEPTLAEGLAAAVESEEPHIVLLAAA